MTKIYEALENTNKVRSSGASHGAVSASGKPLPRFVEDKLLGVYQSVISQISHERGGVVAVAGAQPGEDGSKLLLTIARLASAKLQKRVLVLASAPNATLNQLGGAVNGWEDIARNGGSVDSLISSVGDNLSLSYLAAAPASVAAVLSAPNVRSAIDGLRSRYDLVLIDAPAFGSSSDGALLSRLSDGFVLVVEAGKTRHQAVRQYIAQIESQGGRVLGTILNKRRLYIPGFIYRKL